VLTVDGKTYDVALLRNHHRLNTWPQCLPGQCFDCLYCRYCVCCKSANQEKAVDQREWPSDS